ncbi:AsmA family protein [Altibacter lentus]|uniref:hypothetical protein n=1 Tax=Altibacter lentus TaxID=1223410 RepID=UPI00054F96DC|nr:hypothetical protein [Altibacter lentus]
MSKSVRIFLIVLVSAGILIVLGKIAINTFLKNKVETFVTQNLPPNYQSDFDKLSLDLFDGTITFKDVSLQIQNADTASVHSTVTVKELIIEDISYWKYLFHNEIHIEDIKIFYPEVTYYTHLYRTPKDSARGSALNLNKPIRIDELSIDHTRLTLFDDSEENTLLYAENLTVEIDDILIDQNTLRKRLPLEFGDYIAKADSIFAKVGPYENVTTRNFKLKKKRAVFTNLKLATKYSRQQHAQLLDKERDHFDLTIDSLEIDAIDFGFTERELFVNSNRLLLAQPKLDIYRNKLVADDFSRKPLYSEMLRKLPFQLSIDTAAVKNGSIRYTEKVTEGTNGGTIEFTSLDATIANLGNTYSEGTKTKLDINAVFMKDAPFHVDWSFDVRDPENRFVFKADVGKLAAAQLNQFTRENLRANLEGTIQQTYFTVSGDDTYSQIDMRMKYDEFKIKFLNDNGKDKKWLKSAVANLFIKKNSDQEGVDFREGNGEVTRVKHKSFFNYLWLNVEKGLKSCVTGG